MQGTEIGTGATKKVMPDFIRILDPKDDDNNIQPGVISNVAQDQETAQWITFDIMLKWAS